MSSSSISRTFREQLGAIESIAVRATALLAGIIAVYAVGVELHACVLCVGTRPPATSAVEPVRFFLVLSVSTVVAIAAALGGAFLGFLFGIPRLLSRDGRLQSRAQALEGDSPADAKGNIGRAAILSNSNLEEISDWLTKIIVGVALIQLDEIYNALAGSITFFKLALPGTPAAGEFLLLLAIASAVGAFLFSYMETRTRIALLLAAIEVGRDSLVGANTDIVDKPIIEPADPTKPQPPSTATNGQTSARPASTLELVVPKVEATPEDRRIAANPFDELTGAEEFAAWGTAQARIGNFPAAILGLQRAVSMKPDNIQANIRLAEAQMKFGDYNAAAATLVNARRLAPDNYEIVSRLLIVSLWQDSPAAVNQALKVINEVKGSPAAKEDPWFHLWHAAAQGQRYSYLRNGTSQNDLEDAKVARLEALAAVKQVVSLAPDPNSLPRRVLAGMLHPKDGYLDPYDDDLAVFEDDKEFVAAAGAKKSIGADKTEQSD